jgi:hypothetical protein
MLSHGSHGSSRLSRIHRRKCAKQQGNDRTRLRGSHHAYLFLPPLLGSFPQVGNLNQDPVSVALFPKESPSPTKLRLGVEAPVWWKKGGGG